jgi:Transmembrane domain of unknown function (DUF3566)
MLRQRSGGQGGHGSRRPRSQVAQAGWLTGSANRWIGGRRAPRAEAVVPVAGRRVVRSVDIWTVLRVSFLFYLCVLLVFLIAGALLWAVASTFGVIHNIEKFIRKLFDLNSFHFQAWSILLGSTLGGMVLVLLGTGANVLAALLYNLIGDVAGGVEVTVEDRSPTAAPVAGPPPVVPESAPSPVPGPAAPTGPAVAAAPAVVAVPVAADATAVGGPAPAPPPGVPEEFRSLGDRNAAEESFPTGGGPSGHGEPPGPGERPAGHW